MKKFGFILAAAVLLLSVSQSKLFAQEVEKGNFLLSPGIGFGYLYAGGVTMRTQTGDGTLVVWPVAASAPVAWSIRKVTIVSVS